MASKGTVAVKFVGDIKDLQSSMGEAESKFAKFGKVAAASFAAVAGAAVGVGVGLFKLGSSFDEQFDKIRVGTGATGDALDGLQGSFKNVLKNVPASFEDAGSAIADLNTRLGLTGKPLEDLSGQFINLARITDGDVATSIDNVTRVFGDWGTSAEDQADTMDKLYRAAQNSGIGIDELSTSMVTFGAPLRNLGFGIDESMALLAQFNKTGVNTETVFAGLKAGVGKLAKEGEPIPETFKRIVGEITKMGPGTKATALAIELFGQRAGPDLADAIAGGKFELDGMLDAIANGEDTINGAAKDTESFGEKWTMFKNRVLVGLEPLATGVFNAMGEAMDKLSAWWETNGASIMATVERLKESFMTGFAAVQGVISTVVEFVTGLLDRFRSDHDNAATGVGQAAGRITEILGSLQEMFSSAFEAIKAIVETAVKILTELWDRFGKTLVEKLGIAVRAIMDTLDGAVRVLTGIFDLIKAVLTGKWGEAWEAIKKILGGAWDAIGGVIRVGLNAISTAFEAAKAVISAAWSAIWNGIATFVTDTVINPAKTAFNGLVDFVGGLPRRIAGAAGGMFDGIKNAFRSAVNFIIRGWNRLEFKIPGFDPPGPGPKFGGFTLGLPNIPQLASGGIVKARPGGTLVNVGEGGQDEAVVPLPRGMAAGVTNHFHFPNYVGDKRELVEMVKSELIKNGRRNGGGVLGGLA